LKTRFEGPDGQRILTAVIKAQYLVQHHEALAARIAAEGELVELAPGQVLITQDSSDNELYFIIDGEVAVVVNNRAVATRGPRDSVGEMSLVDGSARRSATILATKPVCALRLSEAKFNSVALDYPNIWRAVAIVVAERLRQRTQFHAPPNEKPVMFIGSSVEGLAIAKQIQLGLKHAPVVPQLWTNGVFGAGGVSIDSLLAHVERSDFAAFVFGPDDKVTSRDDVYMAPRDNVVFELGLYMGRLNRDRCFIVKEQSTDVKIPTDLLGVTPVTYVHSPSVGLATVVGPVCTELEDAVARLGAR
jgi:predicted nucleotide-binding protein